MADLDPADDNTADILYFILYFVITCFAVFFLIIVLFLCFSGRICFYIYYMVYKIQPREHERAPLIVETEYFPRPGYDGYCLMGQEEEPEPELEEARTVVVEAGLVLTSKIDIDIGRGRAPGRAREQREDPLPPVTRLLTGAATPATPANFPRGILTPERRRAGHRHRDRRDPGAESLKAVSFNPKTEFKFMEDV